MPPGCCGVRLLPHVQALRNPCSRKGGLELIRHVASVPGMEAGGGVVKELQAALFPICAKGSYLSSFLQNTLKTNQVEINTDNRTLKPIAKLKEPRDLFALPKELDCPQQAARWPSECQVLDERVQHIESISPTAELYYQPTGREVQPKPVGEEAGQVVFQYHPVSAVNYFSRSSVGGSKYFLEACPCGDRVDGLRFESRFESGNLAKVVKITDNYYELYLRTDLYTNRHMQWYYFRVENTRSRMVYRFSLVNMCKAESLYSVGMRPLLYSTKDAQLKGIGWRRCGDNISYYRNEPLPGEEDQLPSYTLTFNIEFPHDNDRVYLAHCYPYTYSDLQDYLIRLQNHPVKSTYSKLRLLCRSLAGNNVYYLTVTAPSMHDEPKKKKAIVVTARVHPGETPASWMMKGFMDFLTGDSLQARELRDKFIFKLVPMLNPDGVIVGNNRCSLTGRDLNRQYRTVIRETYPPVWHTKLMIRRLMEESGIEMYCDLHAHSRKHNIFIYGCENRRSIDRRLQEQVFPLMLHKNAADKHCKEGTGRVVVWMMGVANSYTMEASFGGSSLGGRAGTHFTTQDYEQMGRHFCETLLDFCDQDPSKVTLAAHLKKKALEWGVCLEQTNVSENAATAPAALDRSPPVHRKRATLLLRRTTLDLGTDPGSDFNDLGTDSGDESSSWRHHSRSRTRNEYSPGRGSKYIPTGDMPPELIVTSAQGQVTTVDSNRTPERQVEGTSKEVSVSSEKKSHKSGRTSSSTNKTYQKLAATKAASDLPRTRQNSLLRSKIWTGIPCSCHEPGLVTHWSSRGEASLLKACSQRLASLQRQRREPKERSRKSGKKPGLARPRRTSMSETSAGEEVVRSDVVEKTRKPNRKHITRRSNVRRPHRGSSNDSSPGDEIENNLSEVKKLLQQKYKLQKWKTIAHTKSSKTGETVGKTEPSKAQPEPSSSRTRQERVRSKPSLKWKFCHAVAAMVTTHHEESDANQERPVAASASDSDVDYKPDAPVVRASSANVKKKKKRKANTGQRKPRRVSSASALPSTSGKQSNNKKGGKSWQQETRC
ncbi:hypothetical protein C0J52_10322 [Blattella germanica]|nr:hypothetical protein C0J52_10322 [Blattella germanica]